MADTVQIKSAKNLKHVLQALINEPSASVLVKIQKSSCSGAVKVVDGCVVAVGLKGANSDLVATDILRQLLELEEIELELTKLVKDLEPGDLGLDLLDTRIPLEVAISKNKVEGSNSDIGSSETASQPLVEVSQAERSVKKMDTLEDDSAGVSVKVFGDTMDDLELNQGLFLQEDSVLQTVDEKKEVEVFAHSSTAETVQVTKEHRDAEPVVMEETEVRLSVPEPGSEPTAESLSEPDAESEPIQSNELNSELEDEGQSAQHTRDTGNMDLLIKERENLDEYAGRTSAEDQQTEFNQKDPMLSYLGSETSNLAEDRQKQLELAASLETASTTVSSTLDPAATLDSIPKLDPAATLDSIRKLDPASTLDSIPIPNPAVTHDSIRKLDPASTLDSIPIPNPAVTPDSIPKLDPASTHDSIPKFDSASKIDSISSEKEPEFDSRIDYEKLRRKTAETHTVELSRVSAFAGTSSQTGENSSPYEAILANRNPSSPQEAAPEETAAAMRNLRDKSSKFQFDSLRFIGACLVIVVVLSFVVVLPKVFPKVVQYLNLKLPGTPRGGETVKSGGASAIPGGSTANPARLQNGKNDRDAHNSK